MRVKGIVAEDFVNYKFPAMFINTSLCDFKCCREQHLDIGICQNAPLAKAPTQDVPDTVLYEKFSANPITKAVVIGGMEPFLQIDEVESLLSLFREKGDTPLLSSTLAITQRKSPNTWPGFANTATSSSNLGGTSLADRSDTMGF